jgi:hypothetical protein
MIDTATAPPWIDTAALSDDELDRLVSDLQAAQAARRATRQQTQAQHEPGAEG